MLSIDPTLLGRTLIVGVFAYAGIIVLLRISGKRTLSKWNAFDFIVTVALGSSLATTMLAKSTSLAQGLLGFAILIFLQLIISWFSVRSPFLQRLLKAEPALLLKHGQFCHEALKRERVTESEVRATLRQHGIAEIGKAAAVVLETDGSFSVLKEMPSAEGSTLCDVRGADAASPQ